MAFQFGAAYSLFPFATVFNLMLIRYFALVCTGLIGLSAQATPATPDLSTFAERSGYTKTGRYDEVARLCHSYAKVYPHRVACQIFGHSPEGRPMYVLVANNQGKLTAAAAHAGKLPVTLIQAGIHAGEIDGKDAGFWALRELLAEPKDDKTSRLSQQVLVFVPVFNVDGHERFSAWNRPNQRGPEQMGWRTTAQNYNLNRDYMKADAPEMQAMLRLVRDWDPLLTVDLHATNGAQFEHDISIQVEPASGGATSLQAAGKSLRSAVIQELTELGSLPQHFYMSFAQTDDPMSGFVDSMPAPRFSTGYFQLRNRYAMLVETHSWRPYPYRVKITRNTIHAATREVARHGQQWQALTQQADQANQQAQGKEFALTYKTTDATKDLAFRGYAYSRTISEISGALMTRYDESKPQLWHVKLRDEIVADKTIKAPYAYVIPAAYAHTIAEKLRQHDVRFEVVKTAVANPASETFRASSQQFGASSFEGRQSLKVQGEWRAESITITAGSLLVPVNQAKARLVLNLFEPAAADAFINWGCFNTAFERKEYMEAYVAEEEARRQLANNPALQAEFNQKLEQDAEFAKSPFARLDFFARRHASWDQAYQRYPVLRLQKPFA